MRKCFIHIGTEKTGTTAIQQMLLENREALEDRGFSYPTQNLVNEISLNHFELAAAFFEPREDFEIFSNLGIKTQHNFLKFSETKKSQFVKIITSTRKDIILSSEHFSSQFGDNGAQTLAQILHEFFDHIKIIMFVRPQWELAASALSTRVQSGQTNVYFKDGIKATDRYFNFLELIKPWEKAFGNKSLIVKNYSNSVLGDFATICGLELKEQTSNKPNKRISVAKLATLSLLNREVKKLDDSGALLNGMSDTIINAPETNPNFDYSSLLDFKSIYNEFLPSNKKFVESYLPSDTNPLISPPDQHSLDPSTPIFAPKSNQSLEDTFATFAFLWCSQTKRLLELEASKEFEKAKIAFSNSQHQECQKISLGILQKTNFLHKGAIKLLSVSLQATGQTQTAKYYSDLLKENGTE